MRRSEVDHLKLLSLDKHEFIISQNAFNLVPGFIEMVEGATVANNRTVEVQTMYTRAILKQILDYVYYKMRYSKYPEYNSLPKFEVKPQYALEVFKAALELGI